MVVRVTLVFPHVQSNKGSTYGEAYKTPSPHSFQFSKRSDRSIYQNRVKVFSSQAISLSLQSIIK